MRTSLFPTSSLVVSPAFFRLRFLTGSFVVPLPHWGLPITDSHLSVFDLTSVRPVHPHGRCSEHPEIRMSLLYPSKQANKMKAKNATDCLEIDAYEHLCLYARTYKLCGCGP